MYLASDWNKPTSLSWFRLIAASYWSRCNVTSGVHCCKDESLESCLALINASGANRGIKQPHTVKYEHWSATNKCYLNRVASNCYIASGEVAPRTQTPIAKMPILFSVRCAATLLGSALDRCRYNLVRGAHGDVQHDGRAKSINLIECFWCDDMVPFLIIVQKDRTGFKTLGRRSRLFPIGFAAH